MLWVTGFLFISLFNISQPLVFHISRRTGALITTNQKRWSQHCRYMHIYARFWLGNQYHVAHMYIPQDLCVTFDKSEIPCLWRMHNTKRSIFTITSSYFITYSHWIVTSTKYILCIDWCYVYICELGCNIYNLICSFVIILAWLNPLLLLYKNWSNDTH